MYTAGATPLSECVCVLVRSAPELTELLLHATDVGKGRERQHAKWYWLIRPAGGSKAVHPWTPVDPYLHMHK